LTDRLLTCRWAVTPLGNRQEQVLVWTRLYVACLLGSALGFCDWHLSCDELVLRRNLWSSTLLLMASFKYLTSINRNLPPLHKGWR
jgi:hypothetical protein